MVLISCSIARICLYCAGFASCVPLPFDGFQGPHLYLSLVNCYGYCQHCYNGSNLVLILVLLLLFFVFLGRMFGYAT